MTDLIRLGDKTDRGGMMKSFNRILLTYFILLLVVNDAMAKGREFSFGTLGYVQGDTAFTNLSVSDAKYKLIMRGDAADMRMPGAGIFEGILTNSDEQKLADAYEQAKQYGSLTPSGLIDSFVTEFYKNGDKVVKLDATVNMEPARGALLITVEFKNTGREEICIESPATWEGSYNPILGNSWISVSAQFDGHQGNAGNSGVVRTDFFGGAQMINAIDYPNDRMCIPSMQARAAKFYVFPKTKMQKGKYLVGASIVIKKVLEPREFAGSIEMNSLNRTIDFPRDYPSTPEEIKAFSAYLKSQEQQ